MWLYKLPKPQLVCPIHSVLYLNNSKPINLLNIKRHTA